MLEEANKIKRPKEVVSVSLYKDIGPGINCNFVEKITEDQIWNYHQQRKRNVHNLYNYSVEYFFNIHLE
jgi:hypothetical protein